MKARHTRVTTELGSLRVESDGLMDEVYLSHSGQKAFTLVCAPGKVSRFTLTKEFRTHDQTEWETVFATYARWKRKTSPDLFKLPNFSGRTKSGAKHPWRRRTGAKQKPVDEGEGDDGGGVGDGD